MCNVLVCLSQLEMCLYSGTGFHYGQDEMTCHIHPIMTLCTQDGPLALQSPFRLVKKKQKKLHNSLFAIYHSNKSEEETARQVHILTRSGQITYGQSWATFWSASTIEQSAPQLQIIKKSNGGQVADACVIENESTVFLRINAALEQQPHRNVQQKKQQPQCLIEEIQ